MKNKVGSKKLPLKKLENKEESCPGWEETFDAALDIIALISTDFEILKINKTGYENIGKSPEELVGKKCYEVVHGLDAPIKGCPCAKALETKSSGIGEVKDHGRTYMTTASPIWDENNEIIALAHTVKDITEEKKAEKLLHNANKDLERKVRERTADLDRKNIALQEIIAQIGIEKNRMNEDIKVNIEKVIFPILEKMKKDQENNKYVDVLMNCIKDLSSSYGINITNGSPKLSPREIEICNMVKAALTNKEIAKILNISRQTVEWHRKKIRQKLGIVNNGINLSSYLHEL
jgi:PAS domain S-box-containing protein